MIPLGDVSTRSRGLPVATVALIVVNVLAYVFMISGGADRFNEWTYRLGCIPGNVTGAKEVTWFSYVIGDPSRPDRGIKVTHLPSDSPLHWELKKERAVRLLSFRFPDAPIEVLEKPEETQSVHPWLSLLTSMFMHGDIPHILGNLVFLWVFGGRLEKRLGVLRYLAFYAVTGILAGVSHVLLNVDSPIPTVGASGAISGLLGGYVLLFPHGRILTLVPIFVILHLVELPAFIFVGVWIFYQFLLINQATNVAVWAHLGGFVFGLALIRALVPKKEPPPRVRPWSPPERDPFDHFR